MLRPVVQVPADELHQFATEPSSAKLLAERDVAENRQIARLSVHPVATEGQLTPCLLRAGHRI